MGEVTTYKDLDVWLQTRILVKTIYQFTKKFPKEEQFGLTNQVRRAAVSIPSNIAEGCGRNHFKDSIQFFFIARASLYELETQIILACDLEYILEQELLSVTDQITRCNKNGFINYYQKQSNNHNDQRNNRSIWKQQRQNKQSKGVSS
jgi:four helix bundle protein